MARDKWEINNPIKKMICKKRYAAKKEGYAFNLDYTDLVKSKYCPILGIKLSYDNPKLMDNSATIDRLNNDLGYIKGNVWNISKLANCMKANSKFWHRCKFVNWVLKTLLSEKRYKKHLKHLYYELLLEVLHNIETEQHVNAAKLAAK